MNLTKKTIPNERPRLGPRAKVAFVGEAPGKDDMLAGRPFAGMSGNLLSQLMNHAGLLRSECLIANLSQHPIENSHNLNSWEFKHGIQQLEKDLKETQPNLIVLLGPTALKLAGQTQPITDLRGTVFRCNAVESPFYTYKCMATFHPSAVQRNWDWMPLFLFDLKRAKEESKNSVINHPIRFFDVCLTIDELIYKLNNWPVGKPAAMDIEGGVDPEEYPGITCMAIAESAEYAFIIDWKRMPDNRKAEVYDAYFNWLKRSDFKKIAHNAVYEFFCIAWKHKITVANLVEDTMISSWEIYPELPKRLQTQTSIWTNEPFYKSERLEPEWETHLLYCCKDAAVTYEIWEKQQDWFKDNPQAFKHYKFNQALLPVVYYMQLKGMRYNETKAKEALAELEVEMDELMASIELLNNGPLNPNSPKQMNHAMYTVHKFEKQYQKEGNKKTTKLTCDNEALLNLLKKYDSDLVYCILKWRHLEGVRKQLNVKVDPDGRIRSEYNIVGSKTGRFSCSASKSGSGYNLQTTTKQLRKLFEADPGMTMFQIDLSGADGWTVAAHSAALGDPAMLEDYLHGVKPAKTICALYLTGDMSIARLPSAELGVIIDSLEIPEWLYAAAKGVQHGSCYGMGERTMSSNILIQSWKKSGHPIHIAPKDCKHLQQLFFRRYKGVLKWQAWVKQQIESKGELVCASGHVRKFFGRRTDISTIQAAYADEPQANTTYATCVAAVRLWQDPQNRNPDGSLIIEPLHQVHDALLGQFPTRLHDFCVPKLKGYFNNPLRIASQEIYIPFEGECGLFWGDNSKGKI